MLARVLNSFFDPRKFWLFENANHLNGIFVSYSNTKAVLSVLHHAWSEVLLEELVIRVNLNGVDIFSIFNQGSAGCESSKLNSKLPSYCNFLKVGRALNHAHNWFRKVIRFVLLYLGQRLNGEHLQDSRRQSSYQKVVIVEFEESLRDVLEKNMWD